MDGELLVSKDPCIGSMVSSDKGFEVVEGGVGFGRVVFGFLAVPIVSLGL